MLKKFAVGLLATALIAGPAFAQTSNSSAAPSTTPAAAPAKMQAVPAVTKSAANPAKPVKHAKAHEKTVKHVATRSRVRSHVKSSKTHQARHVKPVKSHQAKTTSQTGTAAKRS